MELVALMPWWAGVALAVIGYLVLHHLAAQPLTAVAPGQMGSLMPQTMLKAAAGVGQYVVPLIFALGAFASALRRRKRKALFKGVATSEAADVLDGMPWQQFEQLVGEAFRMQGYAVLESGGGGADGGVDLVLSKDGDRFLVQCKQWRAYKVGVEVVRELYGMMAARGAAGGFVVTSGRFTQPAEDFASGRHVKLLDGPKLHRLIKQAQRARLQRAASDGLAAPRPAVPAGPRAASTASALQCPKCAQAMVRRVARRGANAGGEFWGCTGWPGCKGTREIA